MMNPAWWLRYKRRRLNRRLWRLAHRIDRANLAMQALYQETERVERIQRGPWV